MLTKVKLPEVDEKDLQVLLAGLDEIPGKFSRRIHQQIVEYVQKQIDDDRAMEEAKEKAQRDLVAKKQVESIVPLVV